MGFYLNKYIVKNRIFSFIRLDWFLVFLVIELMVRRVLNIVGFIRLLFLYLGFLVILYMSFFGRWVIMIYEVGRVRRLEG